MFKDDVSSISAWCSSTILVKPGNVLLTNCGVSTADRIYPVIPDPRRFPDGSTALLPSPFVCMPIMPFRPLTWPTNVLIWHLKTSNACTNQPFTLSYIISGSDKGVKTATYESLKSFREAFSGFQFTNPKTKFMFPPSHLLNHLDPDVVYIAEHPFLTARLQEYNHTQISDKAFEQKASSALERHLNNKYIIVHRCISDDPTWPNGWQVIAGEDDIAEWEGVWIGPDGHYFFLEAKHSIELASFTIVILLVLFSLTYSENFIQSEKSSFEPWIFWVLTTWRPLST